jgi:hypothetical protein
MKIHVEWTAGVMRLLVDDFGGSYLWSASVTRDGDVLKIKGVTSMPDNPRALVSAIRDWCRENDILHVEWERHKGDGGAHARKARHMV